MNSDLKAIYVAMLQGILSGSPALHFWSDDVRAELPEQYEVSQPFFAVGSVVESATPGMIAFSVFAVSAANDQKEVKHMMGAIYGAITTNEALSEVETLTSGVVRHVNSPNAHYRGRLSFSAVLQDGQFSIDGATEASV